jgi:nucleotide-binding universal stress UspA family protein
VREGIQAIPVTQEVENPNQELREQTGLNLLEGATRRLRGDNGTKESQDTTFIKVLAHGDPAQRVLSYADLHGMDLIVAGTKGQFELRNLVKGDVSRKILHYADCSVLIVKSSCPPENH